MIIIDAENSILGRLATNAAKQALLGEEIVIINADKAIVSGAKKEVFERYRHRYARGVPSKGPFILRSSDRLVKRTIRNMIPYKTLRGREAFSRIKCFVGVPVEFADKEVVIVGKNKRELPNNKFVTIKEISQNLGGKL